MWSFGKRIKSGTIFFTIFFSLFLDSLEDAKFRGKRKTGSGKIRERKKARNVEKESKSWQIEKRES